MTTNFSYTELLNDVVRKLRMLDYPTLRNVWCLLQGLEQGKSELR